MTDPGLLHGRRIIVIEDDYYLATDLSALLHKEGAIVVGCTGVAEEALALIANGEIDCALVDINLGLGPVYETARTLTDRNIPFLFTTGYDAAAIPVEFDSVPVIEKPFAPHRLIAAVEQLPSRVVTD